MRQAFNIVFDKDKSEAKEKTLAKIKECNNAITKFNKKYNLDINKATSNWSWSDGADSASFVNDQSSILQLLSRKIDQDAAAIRSKVAEIKVGDEREKLEQRLEDRVSALKHKIGK
jgi:hypothetical protein